MAATTAQISFSTAATGPDLTLCVYLDERMIYQGSPSADYQTLTYEFDDSQEQEHVLILELQGKKPEHTKINDAGEILLDRCIMIKDVMFDEIPLGHMFTEVARYHHDHNGTTAPLIDSFHGVMGCNGRVEMRFSTPIYLWLLENM